VDGDSPIAGTFGLMAPARAIECLRVKAARRLLSDNR
jgi:hypothetical protein